MLTDRLMLSPKYRCSRLKALAAIPPSRFTAIVVTRNRAD